MATVEYWAGSWTSGGDDLLPGKSHWWSTGDFGYGDSISLTATPVVGNPNDPERILAVENVTMQGDPQGHFRLVFSVRNAGDTVVIGYVVAYSIVGP